MVKTKSEIVSIIVPAYNCEAYLGECLDSVMAQTYPYWECVVVDDGSTDGTFALAESYSKRDNRIRCFRQENQGPAAARNMAVQNSFGEFILPVDADDRIAPAYAEKCVKWFIEHPETTLVYGKVEFFGEENGVWDLAEYNYEDFIWGNTIIICSAMYKKSDFDRVGGYNPKMRLGFEDWDLWLSLLNKDSVVHRFQEVMYYYRVIGTSRSTIVKDNLVDLKRMLYQNHPDVYSPYAQDVVFLHGCLLDNKKRIDYLEDEIQRIRNTHAFKLGKCVLIPFAWIKQKLNL